MKTFFTVFLAILAAAAVIIAGLFATARLGEWERSKRMCYAQISSEVDAMQRQSTRDHENTLALAQSASDYSDVAEVGRRGVASLRALQDSQQRILEIEQTLVAILEQKPFGLPLTSAERKELESARADIQKSAEKEKK